MTATALCKKNWGNVAIKGDARGDRLCWRDPFVLSPGNKLVQRHPDGDRRHEKSAEQFYLILDRHSTDWVCEFEVSLPQNVSSGHELVWGGDGALRIGLRAELVERHA